MSNEQHGTSTVSTLSELVRIERLAGYGQVYKVGQTLDICGQAELNAKAIAANAALAAAIEANDPAAAGKEPTTTGDLALEAIVKEGKATEIVIDPSEPFKTSLYSDFNRQFRFDEPGPCTIRVRLKSDHEVYVDFDNMVVAAEEAPAPAPKPVKPPPAAAPLRAIDPTRNVAVEVPAVVMRAIISPAAPVVAPEATTTAAPPASSTAPVANNDMADDAEAAAQAFLDQVDSLPPEQATAVIQALNSLNQVDSLPPEQATAVKQAAKHLKGLPTAARAAIKSHVARRSTVPPAPQGAESDDDLKLDLDDDIVGRTPDEATTEQPETRTTQVDEEPFLLEQPAHQPAAAGFQPTAHMDAIASDVGPETVAPTSTKKKGKTVSYTLLAAMAAGVLALLCYGAMKASTPATPVAAVHTSTPVLAASPRPTVAQAKPKVVDCTLAGAPIITEDGYVITCH